MQTKHSKSVTFSLLTAVAVLAGLLAIGAAVVAEAADAPTWVGFNGPGGTQVYPAGKVPTTMSNDDIAWQCELPSWGHGQPLAIKGKVFLMVEPLEGERPFPALVCIDDTTGKILWERDLDQTTHLPPAEREPILVAWKKVIEMWGEELRVAVKFAQDKDLEALKQAGFELDRRKHVQVADPARRKELNDAFGIAVKGGFDRTCWRSEYGWSLTTIGQAYATPVSDGERVYCHTGYGGTFCFDFEGKLLWSAFTPLPRIGPWGDPDGCPRARSPILWEDGKGGGPADRGAGLLITDIGNKLRAYDKLTGELKFADDLKHHTIVTPGIITVDGTDILYAAGNAPYELPSGKKLTVEGWKDAGMITLVKHDERDVIFFAGISEHCGWTGKGGVPKGLDPAIPRELYAPPAMVRFDRDGDPAKAGQGVLKATVLWDGVTIGALNPEASNVGCSLDILYHDGKFYHPKGGIIDVKTGKIIAGQIARNVSSPAVPPTNRAAFIVGDHVFGYQAAKGRGKDHIVANIQVYTTGGVKVSEAQIDLPPTTRILGTKGGDAFSYGSPWCVGEDAIYLRGMQYLVKVGGKTKN